MGARQPAERPRGGRQAGVVALEVSSGCLRFQLAFSSTPLDQLHRSSRGYIELFGQFKGRVGTGSLDLREM